MLVTYIQAFASIVALVLSVIAIRQTNKSIRNANRAYISVTSEFIDIIGDPTEYLVIKNFGKSAATIDKITISPKMSGMSRKFQHDYFENTAGTSLAPNQALTFLYSENVFSDNYDQENLSIHVDYHDSISKYSEDFIINNEMIQDLSFSKPEAQFSIQKTITYVAEEILRRSL